MPAIFTPVRLDRVQQALFEVLAEATGVDVQWVYQEVPEDTLTQSFVSMSMVGGPGPFIRKQKRGCTAVPMDSVTLTVGPVLVAGQRAGIVLNEFNYFEDVSGVDTPTTVRDRLIAQINDADNPEPATAVAGAGAGDIDLTPDFVGGVISLSIYGPVTSSALVLNSGAVIVTEGTQTMLVNIQAFSKCREPFNGAWAVAAQCMAALQTEDLVEKLRRFGVGVWDKSQPIDLSATTGGHWETRVSFDVTLSAKARWVRPVSVIETLNIVANTSEPTTTQTITVVL